jgi:hypothetical protein
MPSRKFIVSPSVVMARFMRAIHGSQARLEKISVDGPDKPGHDEFGFGAR